MTSPAQDLSLPNMSTSVDGEIVENTRSQKLIIRGAPVLTATAIACGCAIVALNDPSEKALLPGCAFYAATGWYCPGCGMTRAVHNIFRGNFVDAFRFNAVLVLSIPVLIYFYVWWANWAFTGKRLPTLSVSKKVLWSIIALTVVFAIGRNFPGEIPALFAKDR